MFGEWNGNLSDYGSIASIVSFIATVVLAIVTGSLRKKFQRMITFKDFKADKEGLLRELTAIRSLILSDDGDDDVNIAELSEAIRRLEDYYKYMNKSDKIALKKIKRLISVDIDNKNRKELTSNISTLMGFLKRRVDIDIQNI